MNPSPPTLRSATWTPAIRVGLSIAAATGLYGISFGALAVAAGLSVGQAMALSLLMFTGGSQFAFIGVIAGGGAGSAALGAAALLGVRNAVYGMQLNAMVAPTGWRKAVAAQLTIDESAATAAGQQAPDEQRRGFWVAGAGVFLLWNLFTLLGALMVFALLQGILPWLTNSVWNANSLAECRDIVTASAGEGATGACWAMIRERWHQFLFGFYPQAEYWRPTLAFALMFVALAPVLFSSLPRQDRKSVV